MYFLFFILACCAYGLSRTKTGYNIEKTLYVHYYDSYSKIPLWREKKQFSDPYLDESDRNYSDHVNDLFMRDLTARTLPFSIYRNGKFARLSLKNVYEDVISDHLERINKTWDDIEEVVQVEERHVN